MEINYLKLIFDNISVFTVSLANKTSLGEHKRRL